MPVKKLRPITPGQRHRVAPDYSVLSNVSPEKQLLAPLKKSGGRNNQGRMSVRNIGGGHKRRYRIVDFLREKAGVPAKVKSIEYDPNRSAYLARLYYADGKKAYILAPEGLKIGQEVVSGPDAPPELGNRLRLSDMPLGTVVHDVELRPGKGGAVVRSAGTYAQLLAREGKYATLKLPSGEMRQILTLCQATVGSVSNPEHMNENYGKAGRRRWLGNRPRVRGVAMNPVDHPMGGGEGRASGGHPRSRTGLYAKGKRTRNRKKYSERSIVKRRK